MAKVVSALFHPLLIPTYFYVLLISQFNIAALQIPHEMIWSLAGLIFITTFGLPTAIFMLLLRLKMISSLTMPTRQERIFPILLTSISFYLTYFLIKQLDVAPLFYFYMLGAALLTIICFAINYSYKISLHTTAAGAITGSVAGLSFLMQTNMLLALLICVLLAGLVATARLLLDAHKTHEIYAGFLTGLLFMLLLFYFML